MAYQAGAAFTDESPTAVDTPFGQQLMLPGTGPELGELYRNKHSNQVGCVVRLRQGRYGWVTLRVSDRLTDVQFTDLEKYWQPCRPDGTVR
jgi:hypothetical protein